MLCTNSAQDTRNKINHVLVVIGTDRGTDTRSTSRESPPRTLFRRHSQLHGCGFFSRRCQQALSQQWHRVHIGGRRSKASFTLAPRSNSLSLQSGVWMHDNMLCKTRGTCSQMVNLWHSNAGCARFKAYAQTSQYQQESKRREKNQGCPTAMDKTNNTTADSADVPSRPLQASR